MKDTPTEKQLLAFITELSKLKPLELYGVIKMMGVDTITTEGADKSFEDVVVELVDKFINSNRKLRKEVMKILKSAAKEMN